MGAEQRSIALVLGCGEQGLRWCTEANGYEERVWGCDRRRLDDPDGNFHQIDVLELTQRLPENSIYRIYADFIFNAVEHADVTYEAVLENPDLLQSRELPPRVQKWYQAHRKLAIGHSATVVKELRWLLRAEALHQMWTVLAPNGLIEVIDHNRITDWLKANAAQITGTENIRIMNGQIQFDDINRSDSVRKLSEMGVIVNVGLQKIGIQKK